METTKVGVTPIATRTYDLLARRGGPRFIRHEGGTSSGKTRNVAHAWVRLLHQQRDKLSIVRATGPALKRSVQEDVETALRECGRPYQHNRSENIYTLPNGSTIEMMALDGVAGPQKAHGPRRGYLWINEAPEVSESTYRQLALRTRKKIVLDYNPAIEDDHWVFRLFDALPESECVTIRSTYRDNPYLEPGVVREIEALRETDPYAWTVYGEGRRGQPAYRVLPYIEALPDGEWPGGDSVLGLDFGFHDPMSLVRVARRDGEPRARLYVQALVHARLLTTGDLISMMPGLGVERGEVIWCDSAESDRIEELRRAGYRARPVKKGAGSVRAGVDWLKRHTIYVGGPAGEEARSEMKRYRNKETPAGIVDEPLDADNHAADALRYAAHTRWARRRAETGSVHAIRQSGPEEAGAPALVSFR